MKRGQKCSALIPLSFPCLQHKITVEDTCKDNLNLGELEFLEVFLSGRQKVGLETPNMGGDWRVLHPHGCLWDQLVDICVFRSILLFDLVFKNYSLWQNEFLFFFCIIIVWRDLYTADIYHSQNSPFYFTDRVKQPQ